MVAPSNFKSGYSSYWGNFRLLAQPCRAEQKRILRIESGGFVQEEGREQTRAGMGMVTEVGVCHGLRLVPPWASLEASSTATARDCAGKRQPGTCTQGRAPGRARQAASKQTAASKKARRVSAATRTGFQPQPLRANPEAPKRPWRRTSAGRAATGGHSNPTSARPCPKAHQATLAPKSTNCGPHFYPGYRRVPVGGIEMCMCNFYHTQVNAHNGRRTAAIIAATSNGPNLTTNQWQQQLT